MTIVPKAPSPALLEALSQSYALAHTYVCVYIYIYIYVYIYIYIYICIISFGCYSNIVLLVGPMVLTIAESYGLSL